jgi:hypothetical protein
MSFDLTPEERREFIGGACDRFKFNEIDEKEFRRILIHYGLNAVEVEDKVKEYKP